MIGKAGRQRAGSATSWICDERDPFLFWIQLVASSPLVFDRLHKQAVCAPRRCHAISTIFHILHINKSRPLRSLSFRIYFYAKFMRTCRKLLGTPNVPIFMTCISVINHVFIYVYLQFKYMIFRIFIWIIPLLRVYYELTNKCDQLPDDLIAQSVEHCTGIAEVMGLNPDQAWIFFRF